MFHEKCYDMEDHTAAMKRHGSASDCLSKLQRGANMSRMIMFYVPCPNRETAITIAEALVNEHKIACANIFPMESVYRWKDSIQHDSEVVMIAKTANELADDVQERIKQLHPYEVPCIARCSAEANSDFISWLASEVLSP